MVKQLIQAVFTGENPLENTVFQRDFHIFPQDIYYALLSVVSSTIEHYFWFMDIGEKLQYIIDKIKSVRIKKGVSQMELSLRSNLSQSFIANIEKGKKQPSVLTLIRIADALEVNPQDFFPEINEFDGKEQTKEKIRSLLEFL